MVSAKNFEMMRQQDKQGANKAPRQAYGRDNEPRPQGQRKKKKNKYLTTESLILAQDER